MRAGRESIHHCYITLCVPMLCVQDEDGELSEAFKAQIGLGGSEGFNEVAELELSLAEERDATLSQFNFVKFAKENFQHGATPYHTTEHLRHPLLHKTHDVDKLVS
jgi:hypothetical protein